MIFSAMSLNSPFEHRRFSLKNRLVLPPMASAKATQEGRVNDALLFYYDALTRPAPLGLVITEHAFISSSGRASAHQLSLAEDHFVEDLSRLVDRLHKNETLVFCQLNHSGGKTRETDREKILGVSAKVPLLPLSYQDNFKEMTLEDMNRVKEEFVQAGLRAQRAGFDGLDIHSAHGYLLNQFYSPLSNMRQDAYGGPLENRLRIHLEIIKDLREALGDYPLALRLGGADFMEGGSTPAEAAEASRLLEEAGVDFLDISGGFCGYDLPHPREEGYFKEITLAIREKSSLPLLLTGGIRSRSGADQLLQSGAADLIGVGRAFLSDPLWGKKAFCEKK